MDTLAVVLEAPERLALRRLELLPVAHGDVVVEIDFSGISSGTERLLWSGTMPPFPGMGYPLVPGYESVGRIIGAGPEAECRIGERVFVPGASCYRDAKGLFGGTARRLVVPSARAIPVPESLAEQGILLALAATARHAIAGGDHLPDLIVGHGVLGRLLARLIVAAGGPAPTVWETNPARQDGAAGYRVVRPEDDSHHDYKVICDASGAPDLLDSLLTRLAHSGEIVLAGFYTKPLSFNFPPAFMREARIRVAAEWKADDLVATRALIESGSLSFDGLITHRRPATKAGEAYPCAFGDAACLKMVLDWRECA
ncbi:chlorophyll synthesis pathway protein BchC [Aquisediminimonas profunda]|uniref:chlorophyll synthesis pathway protein BchC n=1 Tax=Aquisediminimonas profunda TaxID=1550733 RepID=UPI001C62B26F|nr:chlorophyll synthesis pathway protein BchC [Aquisediminimonas profunda]